MSTYCIFNKIQVLNTKDIFSVVYFYLVKHTMDNRSQTLIIITGTNVNLSI